MLMGTPVKGAESGGFIGVKMPQLGYVIYAPDAFTSSSRFINRVHKPVMKRVVHTVLTEHHYKVTPRHFAVDAHMRYGYHERTLRTKRMKQHRRGHSTDLVDSGKTRRKFTGTVPKIRMGGAADRVIYAVMSYRFPFPVSRDVQNPRRVTIQKMAEEIARFTDNELREKVERVAELYALELEYELRRRPRLRQEYLQMKLF